MSKIELRWYQKKAAPMLFNYWKRTPNKNAIIAVPTGGGKSIMIADLIHQAVDNWNIDVLVLSHVSKILEQNKAALEKYIEQLGFHIDIGLYSAGLNSREIGKVTIAGIQSVYKKASLFKNVKLVIIDEAHLVPPSEKENTMYNKFISEMNCKIVGYTATPYRLGTGYIVGNGHLFDDIVFDVTSKANYNRLVREGYLSKIISKRTQCQLDADGIKLTGGDYNEKELSLRFDKDSITEQAVVEIIKSGANYKKWLLFAIDIKHAENIAEMLEKHGVSAIPVHSKMNMKLDPILNAYRSGKIRALVNVDMLTTGIDVPDIDLIGILRPTKSPTLYVQLVGRGGRPYPGKDHCLVLDFAKVVETLGPINDVYIAPKRKKSGLKSDPIMKVCPDCDTLVPPAVRNCPICNFEFQFKLGISNVSGDGVIVATDEKLWYDVRSVSYSLNDNGRSPKSIKVHYLCGIDVFIDRIHIEHKGYAKHRANHFIKYRTLPNISYTDEMNNAESMIKVIDKSLMKPKRIMVKQSGKYPEIIDYEF